jgi:hypothetical protein
LIAEVSPIDVTEKEDVSAWLLAQMKKEYSSVIPQDHRFNTFTDLPAAGSADSNIYYVIDEDNYYKVENSEWKEIIPVANNNDYCYFQIWDRKVAEPYVLFIEWYDDNGGLHNE